MDADIARRAAWGLIAGAVWGLVASLSGGRAFREAIWGGVLVSPLIGGFIAVTFRWMPDATRPWRVFGALVSIYTGGVLFAIAMAIFHAVTRMNPPASFETVLEYVMAVMWAITFTGYLLIYWPLAYATHAWIAWVAGE
jgi:hypothetical protein